MQPLPPSDPPAIAGELWKGFRGRLAYDIGAHQGENFTFFDVAGFEAVVAFEPELGSFTRLVERWSENPPPFAVDYKFLAVSDHDGTVELAEVPAAIAKGELVTPGTRGMEWSPEDWADVKRRRVACQTIDSLAAETGTPDLIVVDTEGHEHDVVWGAKNIIEYGTSDWLIEFHSPENQVFCQEWFDVYHYTTEIVRHPHYPPESEMFFQHGWLRALRPEGQ